MAGQDMVVSPLTMFRDRNTEDPVYYILSATL